MPGHLGNDMHDVAVTLNDHEVLDLHCAEIADPAQIIAGQIDQHDVLGALLGVGEQLLFQGNVFRRRRSAAARAGDRANLNLAVLAADVDFG